MLFEIKDNKLVIISEDIMDAKYLESLFEDKVHIINNSDFIRNGFHITDERTVRITFTKGDD